LNFSIYNDGNMDSKTPKNRNFKGDDQISTGQIESLHTLNKRNFEISANRTGSIKLDNTRNTKNDEMNSTFNREKVKKVKKYIESKFH
jgi:hypothetical protein